MVFLMLLLLGICGVVAGEWLIGRLERPTLVTMRVKRPMDLQVPQKVR
ncbi:MAG: hypothetical protein ACKOCN_00075 [Planctomycetaceae bacterium]